jgi:hypothetical protein
MRLHRTGFIQMSNVNKNIIVEANLISPPTYIHGQRKTDSVICVISGFRREVVEDCTLMGYYAASSCNFLRTFRENLSVPSSGFKNKKMSS